MERETPLEARIETIRKYQLLPEKMYKRKLLIVTVLAFSMLFTHIFGSISVENSSKLSRVLTDSFLAIALVLILAFGYLIVRHSIPILIQFIIFCIKWLVNFINPFADRTNKGMRLTDYVDFGLLYTKGKNYTGKQSDNLDEYEAEKKERRLLQGKNEPFLFFRECKLGESVRNVLVFLHCIGYLAMFVGIMDDNISLNKIFIVQFIVTFWMYAFLSKEPKKTRDISIEHLKSAFYYYCSPDCEPLLSDSERSLLVENFDISVNGHTYHKKGHFSKGVYNNQEFRYETSIFVKDRKQGFTYFLTFPTNREYKQWNSVSGKEILTKRGFFQTR